MKPRDFFLNKEFMKNAVIEDHELKGITPEMVDWWWGHIDNSERYKLWHPKDHVSFRWLVPPTPESYIGAVQLVEEYIGGQLRHRPNPLGRSQGTFPPNTVTCWWPASWTTRERLSGPSNTSTRKTPYGVRMRSTFPLTPDTPKWRAQGLPTHNREEMQRLPEFLPRLYREEVLSRKNSGSVMVGAREEQNRRDGSSPDDSENGRTKNSGLKEEKNRRR